MTLLLVLLACSTQTERFTEALRAGPNADCSKLENLQMRGDCLAWKAKSQCEQDDLENATVTCESIEDPFWASECWFLVSDAIESVGESAVTLCARAAEFEEECLGRSSNRALMRLLSTRGHEAEALALTEATWLAFYGAPEQSRAKAEAQLVSGLLRRGRPFSKAGFGTTPEPLIIATLAVHFSKQDCMVSGVDHRSLTEWIPSALEQAGCSPPSTEVRPGRVSPRP